MFKRIHQSLNKKGFTLIELLVVIAIIGILASVVLASLNTARQKSRDAKRISDMKQMQLALELYFDSNGQTYPLVTAFTALATPLTGYIQALPVDPVNANGFVYHYCRQTSTQYALEAQTETTNAVNGTDYTDTAITCPASSGDNITATANWYNVTNQ